MENKAPHMIKGWLANDGRKACWLAEKVKATRPMMSVWLSGKTVPIAVYRSAIAEVTGLDVSAKDLWM